MAQLSVYVSVKVQVNVLAFGPPHESSDWQHSLFGQGPG